ncbi:MetQ/NlpA family ABC transporter substrate-binding protein [Dorea sp. YH-dor226]|uniref:MetQ/NlpA family ABC transporter substrate-binding protein n=1 Tax=Dorea sp. YH-dor226 TaxID=3151119 RepID=UPI0032421E32
MKKRLISVLLCAAMAVTMLMGCGSSSSEEETTEETTEESSDEKQVIKLGVRADFIDMVEAIRASVEEAGYELDVTTFDDSIQPNVALGEGSIDVNWFQHQPYLDSYNAENGTDFVMAQPYTHYPLFAMYSENLESVEDLPDGATIGLCNDATNQARGLKMLQDLGLITYDETVESPTIYDIKDNPKNLQFVEAEMSVLPQSLPDVDAIILAAQHMYNAGLDATKYIAESQDGPDYSLGFVTRKEDADAQWLADLVEAARCDALKEYFESNGGIQIPAF